MTLFRDRYRIESTRLPGWDYASAGGYFVTICTRNRECFLGAVVDGKMVLSAAGVIVAEEWVQTAQIRKNVSLDEWVVMPNHVHGIIYIHDSNNGELTRRDAPVGRLFTPVGRLEPLEDVSSGDVPSEDVSSEDVPPARLYAPVGGVVPPKDQDVPPAGLYGGTIGSILGQFKSVCSKRICISGHDFAWQPRFYDQIVRDDKTLIAIREYIRNNPLQWDLDRENPVNPKS